MSTQLEDKPADSDDSDMGHLICFYFCKGPVAYCGTKLEWDEIDENGTFDIDCVVCLEIGFGTCPDCGR